MLVCVCVCISDVLSKASTLPENNCTSLQFSSLPTFQHCLVPNDALGYRGPKHNHEKRSPDPWKTGLKVKTRDDPDFCLIHFQHEKKCEGEGRKGCWDGLGTYSKCCFSDPF